MAQRITRESPSPQAQPLRGVLVADAATLQVITCPPDAPLRWVADVMAAERVHCVVIEPPRDHFGPGVWRVISDLDLAAAAGSDVDAATASAMAASEYLTVRPDETLERAAQIMAEHEASHLVIVDRSSRPVGVLSTLDIARVLSRGEPPI